MCVLLREQGVSWCEPFGLEEWWWFYQGHETLPRLCMRPTKAPCVSAPWEGGRTYLWCSRFSMTHNCPRTPVFMAEVHLVIAMWLYLIFCFLIYGMVIAITGREIYINKAERSDWHLTWGKCHVLLLLWHGLLRRPWEWFHTLGTEGLGRCLISRGGVEESDPRTMCRAREA